MIALGSLMWIIGGLCFLIGIFAALSFEEDTGIVLILIGGALIAIPIIIAIIFN